MLRLIAINMRYLSFILHLLLISSRKCRFQRPRELNIRNFTQWGTHHGGTSQKSLYSIFRFFKKPWVSCLLWRFCNYFFFVIQSWFPQKLTASPFIGFWCRSFILLFRKISHFQKSRTGRSSPFGSSCRNGFVVRTVHWKFCMIFLWSSLENSCCL